MQRSIPSADEAQKFLDSLRDIRFYQTFELVPGVTTPVGGVDTDSMLRVAGVPDDLTGKSVLDIGAFNGAVGFLCERRGAARVLCTDIEESPRTQGIEQIRDFLDSDVEYQYTNLYDLTLENVGQFDIVICFGVLYHLRHLLLGVDQLYAVTRGQCFIETAVSDSFLPPEASSLNVWLYDYPHVYNPDDHSNFFLPTSHSYLQVLDSCGFDAELMSRWPEEEPHRAAFRCTPRAQPRWVEQGSYEGLFPAKRFRDVTDPSARP
jgi:tRNA (mo5U34)-methyltransferase